MRTLSFVLIVILGTNCILTLEAQKSSRATVSKAFRRKIYDRFDDLLRPLLYGSPPQKEFRRIRRMSAEIVKVGEALVKQGVPKARNQRRRESVRLLRRFDRALTVFRMAARADSDSRLEKSLAALDESFEELEATVIPYVNPGVPPTVVLDCPSKSEAGSEITLSADIIESDKHVFIWTVDKGKILTGQRTPMITVDTTGLAGQTISVTVTVDDGYGHAATTSCKIEVSASQQPQPVSSVVVLFARQ